MSSAKWRLFCLGPDVLTAVWDHTITSMSEVTETEMLQFLWNFRHWVHQKLWKWQLSV